MVKRWYADFKRGRTDTNDAECSGHPNLAVVPENTKKLNKFFLADRKLKLREITETEDIRRQCIHHFVWTFVTEKAVFKVGTAFAHSQSKTTHWEFRVLFATVSTQQKGVFM